MTINDENKINNFFMAAKLAKRAIFLCSRGDERSLLPRAVATAMVKDCSV